MHPCLNVDEILRLLACELVASEAKATAVSFASCCKGFQDPVLDALWETQDRLIPLLKCFPQEVWKEEDGRFVSYIMVFIFFTLSYSISKTLNRVPTKEEWTVFRKCARRMRKLTVDTSEDPVASDILFALQLRTANEPLLPKLKTFECKRATEAFIPFIPSFLSRTTTEIDIEFDEDSPTVMVASTITGLSMFCPDLECITLNDLPRDPIITEAASEMLLTCNRGALEWFHVDSPLTEEARNVVFQLPKLSGLWVIIQGHTPLPLVALPNLTTIDLQYDDHLDWLQGFRGAMLEKLETVYFTSQSEQIGNFLGKFKSVALTTPAAATLSTLWFSTLQPWDPDYRSLLPFTQLKDLQIEFSCENGCSSKVDDNIVMDLARAMPKLEILRLGGVPCGARGGVTVKGLIALARGCRCLSKLRIHFQASSLVEVVTGTEVPVPSDGSMVVRRQDCALTELEVGEIPIAEASVLMVAMTLLRIFPRLLNIEFIERKWEGAMEIIKIVERIDTFVQHISKAYLLVHLILLSNVLPGDALDIGDP